MDTTSISGMQQVTQSAWRQFQFQQAKQFADQAAQNVRMMQSRANAAQAQADRAQENARVLRVEADQAQGVAVQASRSVASGETASRIGPQVSSVVAEAVQSQQITQTQAAPAPTVNTQGETIGTVVNVTA